VYVYLIYSYEILVSILDFFNSKNPILLKKIISMFKEMNEKMIQNLNN